MHGAIGLQPILLEVAASRSSLGAPTGSRTGTSSHPVARQGSCTRGWPGAAGCPLRPRRRGTSRWPRCIRCAAPRPAGRCCRSRRGRSRYRCPIRARQRSSTAALCLQRRSSGSVCCSARAGLQAPQARAQAGSSAARREHAQASHERTLRRLCTLCEPASAADDVPRRLHERASSFRLRHPGDCASVPLRAAEHRVTVQERPAHERELEPEDGHADGADEAEGGHSSGRYFILKLCIILVIHRVL